MLPLWSAATPINGSGQTIAIFGTSKIDLSEVSSFRSIFGLPAGLTPRQISANSCASQGTSGNSVGTATAMLTIAPFSTSFNSNQSLDVTVKVNGAGIPTGNIVLTAAGPYAMTAPLDGSGTHTFTIPA